MPRDQFDPFTPGEDLFVDLDDGRRILVARAGVQVTPEVLRTAGIRYADLPQALAAAEPGTEEEQHSDDEPPQGRPTSGNRPHTAKKNQPES